MELDRRRTGQTELTPLEKQAYIELADEQRKNPRLRDENATERVARICGMRQLIKTVIIYVIDMHGNRIMKRSILMLALLICVAVFGRAADEPAKKSTAKKSSESSSLDDQLLQSLDQSLLNEEQKPKQPVAQSDTKQPIKFKTATDIELERKLRQAVEGEDIGQPAQSVHPLIPIAQRMREAEQLVDANPMPIRNGYRNRSSLTWKNSSKVVKSAKVPATNRARVTSRDNPASQVTAPEKEAKSAAKSPGKNPGEKKPSMQKRAISNRRNRCSESRGDNYPSACESKSCKPPVTNFYQSTMCKFAATSNGCCRTITNSSSKKFASTAKNRTKNRLTINPIYRYASSSPLRNCSPPVPRSPPAP